MTTSLITCLIAGYQWLIILLIVLLLFGGKKIPELMKGVGKGVKAFKEGMNEVENEVKNTTSTISGDKKAEASEAKNAEETKK
ncbi:MAG: twin-arginine translocase TatA/TatE family subunit [Muribaculaceae bacterium]|nr:twin-arginine translocase TatA/TatE family subunit [Muribaculaceae bacterium]